MTGFSTFGSGGGGGGLKYAEVMQLIAQEIAGKQDAGDYAAAADLEALGVALSSKASQAALDTAIANFSAPVKDAVGDLRMMLAGMDTTGYLPSGTYIRAAYPQLAARFPAPDQGALDSFAPRVQGVAGILGAAWFKNMWLISASTNVLRSTNANEGTWITSTTVGGGRLVTRGDGNLVGAYSFGSGTASINTSPDGVTFTNRTNIHTVYGGAAGDLMFRLYPFPGAPGKFLACGQRTTAGDRALLFETVDFTGVAGVRYAMAATDAYVSAIGFWPAAMLWVAAMSDGTVQTSPAGGTAQAPTITGPWAIRATGSTAIATHVLADGNSLYILAPSGRVISATVASPFNYALSVLDAGVSGWQDAVKIGNTWLLTATSAALDGRSRILTTKNFVQATNRFYNNGVLPTTPSQIAVGNNNVMIGDGSGRYALTQPLDLDPVLQFQIPPMPTGIVNASWMVRATPYGVA